ncbi:ferredoxin reductase family protein [Rubrimonas sp.]|uniref:ferredoxin reductase family protein n=1 Tax=Rubrimonas sp. TaxID=2036015 RepID=UPI002FDEEBDF
MTSIDRARTAPATPRLPGWALAAIYLAFCVMPLALAVTRAVAPLDPWERAGAALGLLGLAAMAVQFVTSGRFGAVSGRLGIDKIMAFHKVAAIWVLAALVLHPLLYVVPTWMDDPGRGATRLFAYLSSPHYRSGVAALAALALLVLTSMLRERLPMKYEVWRASHVVLAIAAVAGGLHHALVAGRFSALGPALFFWWAMAAALTAVMATLYGWRWWRLHARPWRLRSVEKLADRMWELDIQPAPGTPDLPYHAGQFVWMTEGKRRFPLFDHPFSIADSPRRPGLSMIIKEAGDFTDQIGALKPGAPIGIDGPYGEFALEEHPGDAVLLIAGGVGVAPVMGILRDMVARGDKRPVRLAYAAGDPDNFACLGEMEAAKAALDLEVMLVSEVGGEGWRGEVGRLDADRLRRLLQGYDPARTVALMCGPGGMVTAVSDMLLELGMPMDRVVYERFDYGGGAASRLDRRRSLVFAAIGGGLAVAAALFAIG